MLIEVVVIPDCSIENQRQLGNIAVVDDLASSWLGFAPEVRSNGG